MSRAIDAGLITALGASTGRRRQLLALEFAGGTVYITTAGQDLRATTTEDGSVLWHAVGGRLVVGAIEEKADLSGSGMELELSGVDQSVIGLLQSDQYRGRLARAYEVRLADDGSVIGSPLRTCRGRMNGAWRIEQTRTGRLDASAVTIKTRITDLAADLDHVSGIQMNEGSHQLYYPGDRGLENVASLANRIVYWDGTTPTRLRPAGGNA